jgi:hypothetical protein
MGPQRLAAQFSAMQRRRIFRLATGILAGTTAALLSVQIALADSMVVAPAHGQPSDPVTATYTYVSPTGAPCPANQLAINFWWDTQGFPIGTALVAVDTQKDCVAVLKFIPTNVKGANTSVAGHIVIAGPGTIGARAPYTIDPPPPPPTTPPPTTPPPTTPPATTPPATTAPATTPPATTPPATIRPPDPPPAATPSASPTATPCRSPAASVRPAGGADGGLMLALILSGALPVAAVFASSRSLWRRRDVAKALSALALAGLLVVTVSCGGSCGTPRAAEAPTPAALVQSTPTPGC